MTRVSLLQRFFLKILFFFVLLSLFRTGFHWVNHSYFADQSLFTIAFSYLHGVRFDGLVIGRLFGVLWVIEFFFAGLIRNKTYATWAPRVIFALETIILGLLLGIFFADLVFFPFFVRHLENELGEFKDNFWEILSLGLTSYTFYVILFLFLWAGLAFSYYRLFYSISRYSSRPFKKHALLSFGLLVLMFLLFRGGWQEQPRLNKEVFYSNTARGANLVASGPFSVLSNLAEQTPQHIRFMPDHEAAVTLQRMFQENGVHYLQEDYPPYRHFQSKRHPSKYNVLLIVMESWPAEMNGAFDPAFADLTQNFDRYAQQGLLFTNYYANGIYTNQGYAAMVQGFPNLERITLYNSPYLDMNFENMIKTFRQQGFYTFALHPYPAGSSHISNTLQAGGMDKVLTMEDYPNYNQHRNEWGLWDENSFPFFMEQLKELKQPYLAMFHNTTTHVPCEVPSTTWEKYGTNTSKDKQKNAIRYSDHYLGAFLDAFTQLPEAQNTVIVITADHTVMSVQEHLANRARIPLLFIMPDRSLKGVNKTFGMQTDLLPSLMDILGMNGPLSGFGSSLFSKQPQNEVVLNSNGKENLWIEDHKLLLMNQSHILGYYNLDQDWLTQKNLYPTENPPPEMIKHYLAYIQSAQNLLIDNRLAP